MADTAAVPDLEGRSSAASVPRGKVQAQMPGTNLGGALFVLRVMEQRAAKISTKAKIDLVLSILKSLSRDFGSNHGAMLSQKKLRN